MPFTNKQAWLYAATWGSYMRSSDPGACMYEFDERFVVQDEEHRHICLDYAAACKDGIVQGYYLSDEPDNIKTAQKAKLRMLRRALRHAQTEAQYQAAKQHRSRKETLKQAGYKYIRFEKPDHILENPNGGLERWTANKNHASYGLIWRGTHLEFVGSYTYELSNEAKRIKQVLSGTQK